MRPSLLDDLSASSRKAEAGDRACVVTAHFCTFDYVLDDDLEDDPDEDDDFDEDDEDEDEDDDEDEDVETWQVSEPYRSAKGQPLLDFRPRST